MTPLKQSTFLLLSTVLVLLARALPAALPPADSLAQAEELIDAGDARGALDLLDGILAEDPRDARALLLRSTAHFMQGERRAGDLDLRRSLELDPHQRQGWLNLAALLMSDLEYEAAHGALLEAEKLDPEAADNDLNLGAVLLLMGDLETASERFEAHLARHPGSGETYYLVATNYAMAGYEALALRHLAEAIRLNEKVRLRARSDANFSDLADNPAYVQLLVTDTYVPAAGSLLARQVFPVPFASSNNVIVSAVLDALRHLGTPFFHRVELTETWALIWADARIKISQEGPDASAVELSAPAAAFSPQEWAKKTETLFSMISDELETYEPGVPR